MIGAQRPKSLATAAMLAQRTGRRERSYTLPIADCKRVQNSGTDAVSGVRRP